MPCPNLGGTAGLAIVFKLNPTGHETVGVYRFVAFPQAGLMLDSAETLGLYRRWRHREWHRRDCQPLTFGAKRESTVFVFVQ